VYQKTVRSPARDHPVRAELSLDGVAVGEGCNEVVVNVGCRAAPV